MARRFAGLLPDVAPWPPSAPFDAVMVELYTHAVLWSGV